MGRFSFMTEASCSLVSLWHSVKNRQPNFCKMVRSIKQCPAHKMLDPHCCRDISILTVSSTSNVPTSFKEQHQLISASSAVNSGIITIYIHIYTLHISSSYFYVIILLFLLHYILLCQTGLAQIDQLLFGVVGYWATMMQPVSGDLTLKDGK